MTMTDLIAASVAKVRALEAGVPDDIPKEVMPTIAVARVLGDAYESYLGDSDDLLEGLRHALGSADLLWLVEVGLVRLVESMTERGQSTFAAYQDSRQDHEEAAT